MSIQMLDWMLENNNLKPRLKKLADLDEADIIFVKEMIAGPLDPETGLPDEKADPNASTWPYRGRPESKSFLYEIIANKINGEKKHVGTVVNLFIMMVVFEQGSTWISGIIFFVMITTLKSDTSSTTNGSCHSVELRRRDRQREEGSA